MSELVYVDSGTGIAVVVDEVAGGAVQYIKLMAGTEDSSAKIGGDATYGLDVDVSRIQAPLFVTGGTIAVTGSTVTANLNAGGALTSTVVDADRALDVNVVQTVVSGFTITGGTLTITGNSTDFATDTSVLAISSLLLAISGHVDELETSLTSITGDGITVTGGNIYVQPNGSWPVYQTTHDALNLNANMQWEDQDVSNGWPLPVAVISQPLQQYQEGEASPSTITGGALLWNESGTTLKPVSTEAPLPIQGNIGIITSVPVYSTTHDQTNVNANLQVNDADVSNTNPVFVYPSGGSLPVTIGGLSLGLQGTVVSYDNTYPINVSAYDLSSAAYSGDTAITGDYMLNRAEMYFTSTEAREILFKTNNNVELFYESGNTSRHISIDFENLIFDSGNQITAYVSQTAGACNMDLVLAVQQTILNTGNQYVMLGETPSGSNAPILLDSSHNLKVVLESSNIAIGGGTQYVEGSTANAVTGNVLFWESGTNLFGPVSSSAPLPVSIDGLAFSGGVNYGDTIINALTESAYDLSSAAYSGTTNVANDWKLSRAGLYFSTTGARDVLFKTDTNVVLYTELNFTGYSMHIDFEDMAFDSGNDVIVYVSQTTGPCNMALTVAAKENVVAGSNAINVTGDISIGTIVDALSETLYDLQSMAYSGETNISSGYRLGKLEMNFSSIDPKDISIITNRGTKIFEDINNTASNMLVNFEEMPFSPNNNISVLVSQTASGCNMNLALTTLAIN